MHQLPWHVSPARGALAVSPQPRSTYHLHHHNYHKVSWFHHHCVTGCMRSPPARTIPRQASHATQHGPSLRSRDHLVIVVIEVLIFTSSYRHFSLYVGPPAPTGNRGASPSPRQHRPSLCSLDRLILFMPFYCFHYQ